ncbi:MAG: 23S rRNA pseudouridine2604 synthase [Paraglaciecola sp.]|jgi:23S rRNA pseudouridine2604 synthase
MEETTSKSLNKYISETGICSRREADRRIEAGRVKINGTVARKGNRVEENDIVLMDDKPLKVKPESIYLAYHKPVGVTCTTDQKDKTNILDAINYPKRIFPIGRLDKDSEGLIFMTNDGDIVNKILRAGNNHEKEYIVTLDKPISNNFIKKMSNGVPILETKTRRCFVRKESKYIFRIILTEGLNRQIRRMCQFFDYKVRRLERIRIMNVDLDGLKVGQLRELTGREMEVLNGLLVDSKKTV